MRRIQFPIGILILEMVVMAFLLVNMALASSLVRRKLAAPLAKALHGRVEIGPVRWLDNRLQIAFIRLARKSDDRITEAKITDLRIRLSFSQILRGDWPVKSVYCGAVEITYSLRTDRTAAPKPIPTASTQPDRPRPIESSDPPRLLSGELLRLLETHHLPRFTTARFSFTTHGRNGTSQGVVLDRLRLESSDGVVWQCTGSSGAAQLFGSRLFRFVHPSFRLNAATNRLTDASLQPISGGMIELAGGLDDDYRVRAQSKWSDIRLAEMLRLSWIRESHFDGSVQLDLNYRDSEDRKMTGEFLARDVVFDLRPYLDPIALLLGTRLPDSYRIARVQLLGNATGNHYRVDRLQITDATNVRASGQGTVQPNSVDMSFIIGVRSELIAWVPGAIPRVFSDPGSGLVSTQIHLTGVLQKPKEDLSARLIASAQADLRATVARQFKDISTLVHDLTLKK